ncbi:hypothetical protein H7H37_20210 [Mycolicibacterium insubricum]|nr:hypothetical protein [Mycolicibacterium insubricum]
MPFTGLNRPKGVAVDSAGNLYVGDEDNRRVLALERDGHTPQTLPFTGLGGPWGVAVDAEGSIYVADAGQVLKLTRR